MPLGNILIIWQDWCSSLEWAETNANEILWPGPDQSTPLWPRCNLSTHRNYSWHFWKNCKYLHNCKWCHERSQISEFGWGVKSNVAANNLAQDVGYGIMGSSNRVSLDPGQFRLLQQSYWVTTRQCCWHRHSFTCKSLIAQKRSTMLLK